MDRNLLNREKVEDRVAEGIKFLDVEYGKSWPRRIDIDKLRSGDCYSCVLAQLEDEDYSCALEVLNLSPKRAKVLGFDEVSTSKPSTEYLMDEEYRLLSELWIDALKKRLKKQKRK